jgi:hypothetical protein
MLDHPADREAFRDACAPTGGNNEGPDPMGNVA